MLPILWLVIPRLRPSTHAAAARDPGSTLPQPVDPRQPREQQLLDAQLRMITAERGVAANTATIRTAQMLYESALGIGG